MHTMSNETSAAVRAVRAILQNTTVDEVVGRAMEVLVQPEPEKKRQEIIVLLLGLPINEKQTGYTAASAMRSAPNANSKHANAIIRAMLESCQSDEEQLSFLQRIAELQIKGGDQFLWIYALKFAAGLKVLEVYGTNVNPDMRLEFAEVFSALLESGQGLNLRAFAEYCHVSDKEVVESLSRSIATALKFPHQEIAVRLPSVIEKLYRRTPTVMFEGVLAKFIEELSHKFLSLRATREQAGFIASLVSS